MKSQILSCLPLEELLIEGFLRPAVPNSSWREFFSSTELPFRVLAIEPDLIDCGFSDFSTFLTMLNILAELTQYYLLLIN